FFAKMYPQLTDVAAKCKSLQDLLGTHQDACTATARLRRYAAARRKQGEPAALPPALVELRKNQLAAARRARRTFRAEWAAFVAAIDATRQALA
ncbi:MAG TPA: CHAD domain-containing protein, partial [Gammaproteobacteria bacterium]|nr:CHAD domain-containing protein [Gammaproteobacteria bacterium]